MPQSSETYSLRPPRIAVIGTAGHIEQAYWKVGPKLMEEAGHNTGNLAFWHAVDKHIAGEKEYFGWNFDPRRIKENFDIAVFVAANQMNEGWDLGELARKFEACDKPMVVVGLGAQANDFDHRIELKEGTRRLLRVFSERCVQIGVRGPFSAEVAMRNGATNVVVIGCPSNFINMMTVRLGREVAQRLLTTTRPYKLCLNLDFLDHLAPLLQKCVAWMQEWGGSVVCQSPLSAMYLSLGQTEHISGPDLTRYSQMLLGRPYDELARRFFLTQCVSFFDAEAWMAFIRGSRLALGTRLHGNLLALQTGVPTVIVPHDARTRELAETIGVPILNQQAVVAAASLPALISEIEFDGAAYDRRRAELAIAYVGLLEASGVPIARNLALLAGRIATSLEAETVRSGGGTDVDALPLQ